MSSSNFDFYTTPDNNMKNENVYEILNSIEMKTFNVGQDRTAPILGQRDECDYISRENIHIMYVLVQFYFKIILELPKS
jgi:hypothetical protein